MAEPMEQEEKRRTKTIPGIGLPAGTDYPNLSAIPSEISNEVYWRKEVSNAFEIANNGYSFHRIPDQNSIFAKDLSGYWYKLNNQTRCFEFLFDGFKDTTDYTRINLPPQAPTFVGFNTLHQAVFPMNDDGRPILPKDDRGKTIFPFYDGYPLFPVDDSGAVCVPLGDDGKPVFPRLFEEYGAYVPCDVTGRVVLPFDEKQEPIYPRDEEGNVLMPFIILEDGSRKRAIYTDDDGTPVLPFHNGEHALEVHEGEVLFQYEYQQKMMMLAQYSDHQISARPAQLMDEQFYQQHAANYQNQMDMSSEIPENSRKISEKSTQNAPNSKSPAANLLLKQLSFLKKKQETPSVPTPTQSTIPSERPAKPNKEKERAGRYIPEPSRRVRPNFRDDRTHHRPSSPDRNRMSRGDDRNGRDEKRRRRASRSRSLTWSPDRKRDISSSKKREKRRESADNNGDNQEEKREKRRESSRKKDKKRQGRSSSASSRSASPGSNSERKEKKHHKREKFRN